MLFGASEDAARLFDDGPAVKTEVPLDGDENEGFRGRSSLAGVKRKSSGLAAPLSKKKKREEKEKVSRKRRKKRVEVSDGEEEEAGNEEYGAVDGDGPDGVVDGVAVDPEAESDVEANIRIDQVRSEGVSGSVHHPPTASLETGNMSVFPARPSDGRFESNARTGTNGGTDVTESSLRKLKRDGYDNEAFPVMLTGTDLGDEPP